MATSPAMAQQARGAPGWNDPRTLGLVERARAVRQRTFVDSTLFSYRADARGFVYFFLDRPDSDERTLVKTDQIALEVYWRAPDLTHQRIVGLRDEKVLPTNIKYHLDHLTVVQDEFPDRIRLGDGDEVADVTHPVAPGAEDVYDFGLSDSLTISLPGSEAVRVYEVRVRPKEMERPGFVGSIFLDRATGAIVRMRFTFTPSSYVDPYLDYIRISLDNLLWEGEHWLPYRQEAEIRREIPQLDFAAGSIIRGRFEIGPYAFNEPFPPGAAPGRGRVSTVPEAERRAYPFEEELYARLEEEGLSTPASIEEIEERAREIVEERYMSGLARIRLHVPAASQVYRYGRAEGHAVGAGTSYALPGAAKLELRAGWAFGREEPFGSLALSRPGEDGLELEVYGNGPRDIGALPAASGVVNTLGGLLFDEDWTDPYFASGAELRHRRELEGRFLGLSRMRWTLGLERHESAAVVLDDAREHRPVRSVAEGRRLRVGWTAEWGEGGSPSEGWGASLEVATSAAGVTEEALRSHELGLTVAWARSGGWRDVDARLRLDAGGVVDPAPQDLLLLGGRGTLPGHAFRDLVGDRFWLVRADASRTLFEPWVSLRLLGAVGQARLDDPLPAGWAGRVDAGVKGSAGAGLALLWEVLRLDLARGIGAGGKWQLVFSVAPRFHPWL